MHTTRKLIAVTLVSLATVGLSSSASALNTGTVFISQMKAWQTYYDIYLPDSPHACGSHPHPTQYKLLVSQANAENMYRVAMAAWFAGHRVYLSYTCAGNDANVNGITAW